MGIESKYMKIDKGPAYLNGITTNTRSVQIWPNDHYLCGQFLTGLESLWDNGMIRMKEKKIHVREREKREFNRITRICNNFNWIWRTVFVF